MKFIFIKQFFNCRLALCEADYALDLSPNDKCHEERSKPLDAEVEAEADAEAAEAEVEVAEEAAAEAEGETTETPAEA